MPIIAACNMLTLQTAQEISFLTSLCNKRLGPALKWQGSNLDMLGVSRLQILYQLLILSDMGTIWQPSPWELHWVHAAWHHSKRASGPLGKVDDWLSCLQTQHAVQGQSYPYSVPS